MRAPLSHLADEVFPGLSTELEAQDCPERSWQTCSVWHCVDIAEGAPVSGVSFRGTLWEAVLHFVENESPVARVRINERFKNDDPAAVAATLNDLFAPPGL